MSIAPTMSRIDAASYPFARKARAASDSTSGSRLSERVARGAGLPNKCLVYTGAGRVPSRQHLPRRALGGGLPIRAIDNNAASTAPSKQRRASAQDLRAAIPGQGVSFQRIQAFTGSGAVDPRAQPVEAPLGASSMI